MKPRNPVASTHEKTLRVDLRDVVRAPFANTPLGLSPGYVLPKCLPILSCSTEGDFYHESFFQDDPEIKKTGLMQFH